MATSDKDNARRAHQAEAARQIASGESVAFFATLLAVLNEVEAAPHPHHRDPEQAPADAAPLPHPVEMPSQEIAPASDHDEKHAGALDAALAESATTAHADAGATDGQHLTEATAEATPAAEITAAQAPVSATAASSASFDSAPDHEATTEHSATGSTTTTPATLDLGTTFHDVTDTIKGLVDSSLATVTHMISDVSASIGQLTTSLTSTLGHLTDGLTGTVANLAHDVPVVSTVEPLLGDLLGTPHANATPALETQASVPLLDTAAAIPTSLFHPEPLHLGFLGQPTIDGHDMHDGAFSALGVHHF